jgi:uroporphyrin-III C-methyltransferase
MLIFKINIMKIVTKGKVILAGAGPGDPELISIKALKYLQQADVILTDRLVSPILIEQNAPKEALVIYVGKQCSKGIHTPQQDINELMVEFAQQGKLVVRLKGGDSSLFSNVLDELKVLKANRIAYEIVPGISAAFGAAAYTSIPLTAREHSRGVRLLTLFDIDSITNGQWQEWAATDDTLVFYMSGQKLAAIAQKLTACGIDKAKGIAVVQQATTPCQKTDVFTFQELENKSLPAFKYVPTIVIIGNVVNLHQKYKWLTEKETAQSYFDNHKNIYQDVI